MAALDRAALGFSIGEFDYDHPAAGFEMQCPGGNDDGGGLLIGNQTDLRGGSGGGNELLRPGGGEVRAVGAAGVRGLGDLEDLDRDFHLLAAGESGGAGEFGLERAGSRFVEEGDETQFGGSRDESGEGGMCGRTTLRDQGFDRVAGGPAAVLDGSMIENPGGGSLEFELGAVGFELGEGLFRPLVGGFEGFQGELVEFKRARNVGLGFFEVDGGIALAVSEGFRLARERDPERALAPPPLASSSTCCASSPRRCGRAKRWALRCGS